MKEKYIEKILYEKDEFANIREKQIEKDNGTIKDRFRDIKFKLRK